MSRFDPEFYVRYRPHYPAELYAPLARQLTARRSEGRPWRVADLGCGTGHSAASLLAAGIEARVHGVDPDPAMLERAANLCPEAAFSVGSGEVSGLPAGEFDAVTIGSALHWMRADDTCREVLRLLRPGGLLLVYEYQFPKARGLAELNEWIRREFNLRWKAPGQKPRGDFAEVTARFRSEPRLELLDDRKVRMVQHLEAGQLTGLLLSQSRVLHYEAGMNAGERAEFQRWLGERIAAQLPGNGGEFDFGLQAALLGLR